MLNTDIIKGSKLMVFIDDNPIAFATSHSLSITMNTTEVSTKDHGDFPAVIAQNISWEITTENLYSNDGQTALWNAMKSMQPVTIKFAPADNYSNTEAQYGIVGQQGVQGWTAGTAIASGKALVTSLSVNAPAGDNSTLSATFTGVGELDQARTSSGQQGTQGEQGNQA